MTLLDAEKYEAIALEDLEYELRDETVGLGQVRKGDFLCGKYVAHSRTGTKWGEAFDESGRRITRDLLGTLVTVQRKYPTKESSDRRYRATRNERIARALQSHNESDAVKEAVQKIAERIEQYGEADYQYIGQLMETQAAAKVWRRFAAVVEYFETKEDFEGDIVDVLEEFKQSLRDSMCTDHRHRALSRSTNQVSNLMEDCDLEAEANFLNKHWYFG